MLRFPFTFALLVLAVSSSLAACAPATANGRGVDLSFHPSGRADGQERLVSSAVELKSEGDTAFVKEAGGLYLGEIEVIGETASSLVNRVSLEAANRGATHFYLASSRVDHDIDTAYVSDGKSTNIATSTTRAWFVLFRVEPQAWERLPSAYKPGGAPSVTSAQPFAPPTSTTGQT